MSKLAKQIVKLTREDKALELFQAGVIVSKVKEDLYHVKSQKDTTVEYEVIPPLGVCTCIDFERNGHACKHIIATQIFRTSHIATTLTAAKISALNKMDKVVMTR
jgi:hypothetical protein